MLPLWRIFATTATIGPERIGGSGRLVPKKRRNAGSSRDRAADAGGAAALRADGSPSLGARRVSRPHDPANESNPRRAAVRPRSLRGTLPCGPQGLARRGLTAGGRCGVPMVAPAPTSQRRRALWLRDCDERIGETTKVRLGTFGVPGHGPRAPRITARAPSRAVPRPARRRGAAERRRRSGGRKSGCATGLGKRPPLLERAKEGIGTIHQHCLCVQAHTSSFLGRPRLLCSSVSGPRRV